ncbi:2-dehydro-3-deoxygalactonokinase [Halomonas sp. 3H]|uniref:2-dehydro-3-deoxygalactonokinase n=1 Tax=Halomonas sp. 3H TaxID=2952527 RepID=UPI0020B8232E|nr:2-dehydro-3-deoxygalactonokinase [Halomonas sp. 3H]
MVSEHLGERVRWIGVDWGSSRLRAWALDAHDDVLASGGSDRGMLSLAPDDYESALLKVIGDWLPDRGQRNVLVCGMAGARQGWREAAYLPVPTRLDALARGAVAPPCRDPRVRVRLLPGLCQTTAGHFDVMRGEETQLAGLVASEPEATGLVCLPGTHAKWARLEQGTVTHFTTFLTGELYALLARQSVLRHSVDQAQGEHDLADSGGREAFVTAVRETLAEPGRYSARLFGLRAADLLDADLPPGRTRATRLAARLSGLTIGLELAGLALSDPGKAPEGPITLIGDAALCDRYALALEAAGHASLCLDGERAVLAGLALGYRAQTHRTLTHPPLAE